MKIYFTASIIGKRHYLPNYKEIITRLRKAGHSVISEHIINTDENQIRLETKKDRLLFQEKLEKWINSSECLVAETSFPSISVGFEISLALSKNKPVLLLYTGERPPSLLAHHKDENLICEKYSAENLAIIINDFLGYVKGNEESRFTFYITSEIASFLEKVAKKYNIPKAVYLRKLIEKEISSEK